MVVAGLQECKGRGRLVGMQGLWETCRNAGESKSLCQNYRNATALADLEKYKGCGRLVGMQAQSKSFLIARVVAGLQECKGIGSLVVMQGLWETCRDAGKCQVCANIAQIQEHWQTWRNTKVVADV